MFRLAAILFLLMLSLAGRANDYPYPFIETQNPTLMGEWTRIVMPLKRSGNLLLIQGKIDSIQGDFILDTGAPYLILNATYFHNYSTGNATGMSGVDGANAMVKRGYVNEVNFGELHYTKVDCDVVPLGQLENKVGSKILGLFGTNLFSDFKVYIDAQQGQMILYRKNANNEFVEQPELDSLVFAKASKIPELRIPFKWCDNKIFMPVEVGGVNMNWMFDTGAESNVIDAMVKKKALREFNVQRRVTLTGTGGSKQEVFLGTLNELSVGDRKFEMQTTILTGMKELNETCSVFVDGILGHSFYSQGIFSIDFSSREFCLYLYVTND